MAHPPVIRGSRRTRRTVVNPNAPSGLAKAAGLTKAQETQAIAVGRLPRVNTRRNLAGSQRQANQRARSARRNAPSLSPAQIRFNNARSFLSRNPTTYRVGRTGAVRTYRNKGFIQGQAATIASGGNLQIYQRDFQRATKALSRAKGTTSNLAASRARSGTSIQNTKTVTRTSSRRTAPTSIQESQVRKTLGLPSTTVSLLDGAGTNVLLNKTEPTVNRSDIQRRLRAGRGGFGTRDAIVETNTQTSKVAEQIKNNVDSNALQGFQGDIGTVGDKPTDFIPSQVSPTRIQPVSKFVIIGGRAVPIGAIGGKVGDSNLGISKVQTRSKITGEKLPNNIIDVFTQERNVSVLIAKDFQAKRNLALGTGATIDEAQEFAKAQTSGLSKDKANAINTALQKAIIEKKAGQIELAKELIANQNSRGELDDLAGKLENAEPIPATNIDVTIDADGVDANPRKTRLAIENALLTGNSFEDLSFNINKDESAIGVQGGILNIAEDGSLSLDASFLSPETLKIIANNDVTPFEAIINDVSESRTSPQLVADAQKGFVDLNQQDISNLTVEGNLNTVNEVSEGIFNKIIAGEVTIEQLADGTVNIINIATGETLTSLTPTEATEFFENFGTSLQEQFDAGVFENPDQARQIQELLSTIDILLEQLRGGENINTTLAGFFNIFAELQRIIALQQGEISALQAGQQEPIEEDAFGNFFNFIGGLFDNFIAFVTGGVQR